MDIENKTIWQIAAGNGTNTHYSQLCLQKDVVIFGPGQYGAWPDCEAPMRAHGWTATKAGIIRRFAEEIKRGDLVVLRVGTQHIYGVGEVVSGYGWSELFKDVQGWDLQHYRRVRWLWHQDGEPETFPVYSLKFGSSVQHLISPLVRRWLEMLEIPDEAYMKSIPPFVSTKSPPQDVIMNRVVIVGNAGSGKSTLARALGARLGLPVVHLDAVFWKPGWIEPDKAEFDADVLRLTAQASWVIDGNYSRTLDARLAVADLVVFLDFSRWRCLARVCRRRLQYHGKSRPDMGTGCPEKVDLAFLRWVWNYNRQRRPVVLERLAHAQAAGKGVARLRNPQEVRQFLVGLPAGCNFPDAGVSQLTGP